MARTPRIAYPPARSMSSTMSEPARERDHRDGARAVAPLAIAVLGFGASYGVLARAAGMGVLAPIVMSATTFAGSAQFAAASILGTGGATALSHHRRHPAQRPVRPDRRQRRALPHRRLLVPLPARPAHRRRDVGGGRRGRGPLQSEGPARRRADPLRRLGARHHPGCRVRRRHRRPRELGLGRRLPRPLPGAPGPPAQGPQDPRSGSARRGDRPRAHAVRAGRRSDHRCQRRLSPGSPRTPPAPPDPGTTP